VSTAVCSCRRFGSYGKVTVLMSFKTLLRRLRKPYGTVRAFADALGIEPSRVSRGQPFDVRGCLKLAQLTGENPSVVLRAAGKADIATLIEAQYGTPAPKPTPDERELLAALHAIPEAHTRRLLVDVARSFARLPPRASASNAPDNSGSVPPVSGTPPPEGLVHGPDSSTLFPRRASR